MDIEPGGTEGVLPHELTDEMERGALGDDRPRPRTTPDRVPVGGPGGESTSGRYESLLLALPLLVTVGLVFVWVVAAGVTLLSYAIRSSSSSLPGPGVGISGSIAVAGLVTLVVALGIVAIWATRRSVAEWLAMREHTRLRRIREEMLLRAFNCHVEHLTQVGVRYGLARSLPPGAFSDFIGYLDLRPDAVEVWWASGREAGGFLIPKAWIARVWPVELWLRGNVPVQGGPPALVVPYIEYVDPRTQTTRILSFESAESVVPDKIAEESRWLADRLCMWFYGKSLTDVYIAPRPPTPSEAWPDAK